MRLWLRHLLIFGVVAASLGLLFVWLGLVSISASTQHWPPAKWFLHFAMREAVQTQARGIEAPPLDDARLLAQGAGAYAYSCATCHGAPGQSPELFASVMIPPAPPLPALIADWNARELFWIVKNGIKYTAMPAWPSPLRDDEVWAIVALLKQLPALSVDRYRLLAYGDAEVSSAERKSAGIRSCMSCHGEDGLGRDGTAPVLAGQSRAYLERSLREYASGQRHSGVMQALSVSLSEPEIEGLAAAFSAMRPPMPVRISDATSPFERGARIAAQGVPERDVAACIACHPLQPGKANPGFPVLLGQDAKYQTLQLSLFAQGIRAHTPMALLMRSASLGLNAEEIEAVSVYYEQSSQRR